MDLGLVSIFFTVVLAHFLALLSPGPDFVIIVKSAMRHGHKSIGVAVGIAIANAVYIALCLVGVGSILASSVTLLIIMKVLGGLFLLYLAIQALRAKKTDYEVLAVVDTQTVDVTTSWTKQFITGFMSGILNPKNLLFYLSLFTVVLTKDVGMTFKVLLGIWMTSVVFLWDVFVIYILSVPKVRAKFSKMSYYIDKVTGMILGAIGFSIVRSAVTRS